MSGCSSFAGQSYPQETVLQPSEVYKFSNVNGNVSVKYAGKKSRVLLVNGESYSINAQARKERFRNILGIYQSGRGFLGRINDVAYVEAEKHFKTLEEARKHLIEGSALFGWSCGDKGIVGGYFVDQKGQINVSIFRYLVDGQPAQALCEGLDKELEEWRAKELRTKKE
jgi:hypothetical protein